MAESYRAGSGISEPSITGLPRVYTTERQVPPETALPVRGQALGSPWGAYANYIVIDAQDVARGNARIHVVSCITPGPWSVLYGSSRDRQLNAPLVYSQQIIPTPSQATVAADTYSEYTPLTEALSMRRTQIVPTAALNAFYQALPSSISNLNIPRILESLAIVWHEDESSGSFDSDWVGVAFGVSRSLSGSESGSAQGSASVIPELVPVIREIETSRLASTSHFFFLPMPVTSAAIIAALSSKAGLTVSTWPVFKPRSETVVLRGRKVSAQAQASASAAASTVDDGVTINSERTQGGGVSYDTTPVINVVTLPPTIHAAITISNTTAPTKTAGATAAVEWTGTGGFPSATRSHTASLAATGSVSPTTLSATTPAGAPTSGIYLVDSKVEPYDYGYAMVFAETLDASQLA